MTDAVATLAQFLMQRDMDPASPHWLDDAKAALSALEAEGYEVRPKSGAIVRLGSVEAIDFDPAIDGVRLTVVVPDEGWGSQVLIAPLAATPKHGGDDD